MSAQPVIQPERFEQVRLDQAVLCADCDCISNTPYAFCPACGSRGLLQLARALNGAREAA